MFSNHGRTKLRQLGWEIHVVADFGRPYLCMYHHRGYYTIEDWISFTETYTLLLLGHGDILEPGLSVFVILHAFTGGAILPHSPWRRMLGMVKIRKAAFCVLACVLST